MNSNDGNTEKSSNIDAMNKYIECAELLLQFDKQFNSSDDIKRKLLIDAFNAFQEALKLSSAEFKPHFNQIVERWKIRAEEYPDLFVMCPKTC